ncbi:MAG: sulfatase [Fuerstia sp.]|nr:sulfatase [Fuerstiella sp.]
MRIALWTLCGMLIIASPLQADSGPGMNFVFVLIDDLGWADLSCCGSTFHETPNLDALARSGVRFTHAYAACPVCSPTRASIMTGRHPVRVDITDWIPGQNAKQDAAHRFLQIEDRNELPLHEFTIAEILHDAGYQTFFAGKWHLGGAGFLPTDQGFDVNLGGGHWGQPPAGYFAPWKNPYLPEHHAGEYITERLTQESVAFLKGRDPSRPFLLFLSHYDVHTPIHRVDKHFKHFEEKRKSIDIVSSPITERRGISRAQQDNAEYASMVSAIDDSVGQITAAMQELGLEDSTTIIFTSDNGGLCTLRKEGPTCNLPLRSGKGWLYEGGIRVPLIVRVPGITKAGEESRQPVLSTDFFPTMLELAGIHRPTDIVLDGDSIVQELRGEKTQATRPLVWHYPHYHGSEWTPGAAIRAGDWKLIEFYEFGDAELYNLETDPGEKTNLAELEPDRLYDLRKKLQEWQEKLHAKMPQPNPLWVAE